MNDCNYGNPGLLNNVHFNRNNPRKSGITQNDPLLQQSFSNITYPENPNMPIVNVRLPATNGYVDESNRDQYLPLYNGTHTSAVPDFPDLQSTENVKLNHCRSSSLSPIESIESMFSQCQLSSESRTTTLAPMSRQKAVHFTSNKNQQINSNADFHTHFLNSKQNDTYIQNNQTQKPPSFNQNGGLPVLNNSQMHTNTFDSGEFGNSNVYNTAPAPNGRGAYYENFIYPPMCSTNAGFSSDQMASNNASQMGSNETYLDPGSMNLNWPASESANYIPYNLNGQSATPRVCNIPPEREESRVNIRNADQISIDCTMQSLFEPENRPYPEITQYHQYTNNPASNQSQNLPAFQENPFYLSDFHPVVTKNHFINNERLNNTNSFRLRMSMPGNVSHIPSRSVAPPVHGLYQPEVHMGGTYPSLHLNNCFGPNSTFESEYPPIAHVAPMKYVDVGRQPNDARKQSPQAEATGERNSAESPSPKRRRTSFTLYQQKVLEEKFKRDAYVTKEEIVNLADKLNLENRRVRVWFQNRRMRERKNNPDALKEKMRGGRQKRI